jgi:hypothetical protein
MEILGRNPTPDKYSIAEIRIEAERHELFDAKTKKPTGETAVELFLLVSLKPEAYSRRRFTYGHSYRPKENPCVLRMKLSEFYEIEQALRSKLEGACQFLSDRDLLFDFLRGTCIEQRFQEKEAI